MAFPLKTKVPLEDGKIDYKYKLQNHEGDLVYDPNVCIECGYCLLACPKEAITLFQDVLLYEDKSRFVDQEKCVQCGVCAYVCPVNALSLEINGEERIILTETEMLPKLTGTTIQTPEGLPVKKWVEGSVTIDPGRASKESLEVLCKSCPTGALSVNESGDGVDVDDGQCIYCIRCSVFASRIDEGIVVRVRRRRFLKDSTNWKISAVWNRVTERVLGPEGLNKDLQGSIQVKLAEAALKLKIDKHTKSS